MKFWMLMPFLPPEELVTVAIRAEEAGFEGVALADHASQPETIRSTYPYGARKGGAKILPSPLVMVGALSTATTRLRFTTWVLVVPLRHPILLAKEIATAARLSQNRLELGIGLGWMREEFEAVGIDPATRGARLDEMWSLMTRMWTGEYVGSDTELFRFEPNLILPTLDSPPPLLVGGHTAAAIRRTARIADGWVGAYPGADELARILAAIDLERTRASAEMAPRSRSG